MCWAKACRKSCGHDHAGNKHASFLNSLSRQFRGWVKPRRVDGTYVKKTRPVEGPTFNGANKILEIIVTPEPTPNPPLHIMKSPEHLGFGSNYRSLYFIFGLKVRPKMLAAC